VQIVDKMKALKTKGYDMRKVRLQVQLHKIVWDPDARGV
jgi:organic radical activating enzyme